MKTVSLSQQLRNHAHIIHHIGWRHWRLARRVAKAEPSFLSLFDSAQLFGMLQRLNPHFVLELGDGNSHLLEMWTHFLKPGGTLIGVDLNLELEVAKRVDRNLGADRGLKLFNMPAHQAIPAMRQFLGGGRLDVVLLPDHDCCQQRIADFERFLPMVRKGGLLLFPNLPSGFETAEAASEPEHQALSRYWQDLRRHFFCQTLGTEAPVSNRGLGLVWV